MTTNRSRRHRREQAWRRYIHRYPGARVTDGRFKARIRSRFPRGRLARLLRVCYRF